MKPTKIIPSRRWQHKTTKRTASVYGACPASGAPGDTHKDWEIVDVGWTTANDNGTVGLCRPPFATAEGLQAHVQSAFGITLELPAGAK